MLWKLLEDTFIILFYFYPCLIRINNGDNYFFFLFIRLCLCKVVLLAHYHQYKSYHYAYILFFFTPFKK